MPAPPPLASATCSAGRLGTWFLFAVVAVATTVADLLTKTIAFEQLGMPGMQPGIVVIRNMLWWETNLNEGALFGLGQGMGWLFITVSVAALIGIAVMVTSLRLPSDGLVVVALALISGGILGNLYDRLGLPGLTWHAPLAREGQPVYAVRDFIHFRLEGVIDWPIFNLADSFLVAGAGLLILLSVLPAGGGRPTAAATAAPNEQEEGKNDG